MANTIRYLGIDQRDSRLCFMEYQKGKVRLAEKMANITFSVIARSCNKMIISKTYWKSVIQLRVLSAADVYEGGGKANAESGKHGMQRFRVHRSTHR